MTVSPFAATHLVPIGGHSARIRIKRIINDTVVRMDAQEYNRQQIVVPCCPQIYACVCAAALLGPPIDQDVKPIGIRPW